jgi:NIPSNAP
MIYDHRTYVCKPGTIKAHIELYQKMGYAVQTKHLGKPVLWATTEVGDVNSYVHVWAYKDLAERTTKRAAMWADPAWSEYVKASGQLGALIHQENKILIGAAFAQG